MTLQNHMIEKMTKVNHVYIQVIQALKKNISRVNICPSWPGLKVALDTSGKNFEEYKELSHQIQKCWTTDQ